MLARGRSRGKPLSGFSAGDDFFTTEITEITENVIFYLQEVRLSFSVISVISVVRNAVKSARLPG